MPKIITERKKEKLLKESATGNFTLEQLGEKYGVTRERIRQIYKKATGLPYRTFILTQRIKREELYNKKVKFICGNCEITVLYKDDKRSGASKYCKECRKLETGEIANVDLKRWHVCKTCGISFHPKFRGIKSGKSKYKGYFCSAKCYFKSPKFQQTIQKAIKTHKKNVKNKKSI